MSSFLLQNETFLHLKALGLVDEDGNWIGGTGGSGVSVVEADPVAPTEGQVWILKEGASPDATLTLKAYVDGAAREIAAVGY
jgi:hypothetical protein